MGASHLDHCSICPSTTATLAQHDPSDPEYDARLAQAISNSINDQDPTRIETMSNAIAEYNPQQAQYGYQSNDPLQQRQQAMIGGQMAGGQMAGGQMAGGNGYGGGAMVAHQGADTECFFSFAGFVSFD